MDSLRPLAALVGRILIAAMFVMGGISKITGYAGTQQYMEAFGIPGWLLPLVIATEILGGIAIIVGWQTRLAALALACFTILAALFFHSDFADQMQMLLFMKNMAIVGGFLFLFAFGAGALSLDKGR